MKKLLTILMSIAMVLAMMPGMAWAETPVADTDVCRIGDTGYATLKEAINNAADNDVIVLLKNTSIVDQDINIAKTLTIDLNGNEVAADNSASGNLCITETGNVTLKDSGTTGKIYATKDYVKDTCDSGIILNFGTFLMDSGYIYSVTSDPDNKGQFGITYASNSNTIINGGTIEAGWYALAGNGSEKNGAEVTINGGTLISVADYAVYQPAVNVTLTVNDGVIYGAAGGIDMNNGQLIINGGTITSKGTGDTGNWGDGTGGLSNAALNLSAKYGDVVTNLLGGRYIAEGNAIVIQKSAVNSTLLSITGGEYTSDPTEYVDSTKYLVEEKSDGYYIVLAKDASGITLNPTTLSLVEGKTATLTATVTPENVADKSVTWTSSDDAVATVDNGVVTAVKEGTATITATTTNELKATCAVTVTAKPYIPPTPPVTPPAPSDPVTNTGTSDTDNATTNADISKDTTSKTETTTETKPDGTTSTTTTVEVSDKTAAAIVDKAVEHQSAEVVVDTTTSAVTTAPAEGDKTEVKLPAEIMQTIAEKTTADVTIKSDVAEVTLDAKAVDAVAEQVTETKAATVTLVVENTKNEAEEMHFELNLVTESGKVTEFKGGNVKVTVKLNTALKAAEKVVCVYIDDNGIFHKVDGYKNLDGTFTFKTTHFSTYAIMTEEEADKVIEEQKTDRIIAGVQNTTIKARSEAKKGQIRVIWKKSYGYKVDYFEVYKAKSKAELKKSTKPYFKTKNGKWVSYKNTKGLKKGTKYYYRVRGVREINGVKYYTQFSTMAYRYAK